MLTQQLTAARTLQDSGVGWLPYSLGLAATFSYDNEGRMTGETYPTDNSGMTTGNVSYTFDSLGRLNTMTDNTATLTLITGTSYGPANELLSITANGYLGAWGTESRSYNSLKQLTQLGSNGLSIQYNYPSTGNNGKIASQADLVSGEQVSYTYDALNRLATAATQSTFTPQWAQSYSYDGFGNLTNVTQDGTTILTASYDANNHAGGEDANGNPGYVPVPIYGTGAAATYDVENRLVAVGGVAYYAYAPGNKRVWRGTWTGGAGNWTRGTDEITFFSVSGQKLAAYALTTVSGTGSPQFYATQTETNYYFGSKLIKNINGWVYSDRLGSVGKFYPYGIERPSATTNGTEKFTGYFRDSETGNDYAVNRYMSPGTGRFITPDRIRGNAADPGSWNKYAYTGGDPINRIDPSGTYFLQDCIEDGSCGDYFEDPLFALTIQGASYDPNSPCSGESFDDASDACLASLWPNIFSDPTAPTQVAPTCDITLYERPVAHTGGLAVHTYLVVDEFNASGALVLDDVLEGGPQHPHNFVTHPFAPWGNLVGFEENILDPNTKFLGTTNPSSNTQLGSEEGGTDVCDDIAALMGIIPAYNSTGGVPYSLTPWGNSRNSNSFTYTLLYDVGLANAFQNAPSNAPGWGMLVPGLYVQ